MSGSENMTVKKHRCHCQLCRATCGMLVRVEDDRIVDVEGDPSDPKSRGMLCVKGRNSYRLVDAPDRLLYPLVRGGDGFEATSWKEALDGIATRLAVIRCESGAGSVVVYRGFSHTSIRDAMSGRFANAFGTPNLCSASSLCVSSKIMGYVHTFGPPRVPRCDFRNSRCILLMGANPAVSVMNRHPHVAGDIKHAQKNGAKLIVVDPRRCEAARDADIYLQLRPGTDLALLLGMLNVVISEGLYDADFVERYTTGFSELAEKVVEYTPEWASRVTGLGAAKIVETARLFATTKPASLDRQEGVQHHVNGYQTIRAMACLIAVTGNVDCDGGLLFNHPHPMVDLSLKGLVTGKPFWAERFPLAPDAACMLPDEILSGRVRAMLVLGGNPVATWANSNKTSRALGALDLLVVHDLFMTETAEHAHYALPASSFFEKLEVDGARTERARYLYESQPAVSPRGDSMAEWEFFCELGRRFGMDGFDFRDADDIADRLLAKTNFPRDRLREASYEEAKPGWLREDGFKTPSAKIELYSETLAEQGYDPIPGYVEPSESPASQPGLAKEYPLVLTTGARLPWFIHSQLHNIKELSHRESRAPLEIDGETARKLGISDGDDVVVETPRGKIEAVARYSDIFPGAVSVMHGFPGTGNANLLTDDEQLDPVSATPAFRSLLCRVRPA